MNFFSALEILSSGMSAQRVRLNVTASNLANANSTRGADGKGPYQRRDPVFEATPVNAGSFDSALNDAVRGVAVPEIVADQSPPRAVYDPSHPDADPKGFVQMPNVNMVEEMVNMLTASRAYEANVTAMRAVIDMAHKLLDR